VSVLSKLASSLGRRDEGPNEALAAAIVKGRNRAAVAELAENLTNKNKAIQSDCIKVLYEIGEREPALIAKYAAEFGELLGSRNNRLVWGAMTALDAMAAEDPKGVHGQLSKILVAAEAGSVIARDHAVGVLIKLAGQKQFAGECLPLLFDQLKRCPGNQLPMYAERSLPAIGEKQRIEFARILNDRLDGLAKESQKKRLRKVLKHLAATGR
jgi:hypothetical protein